MSGICIARLRRVQMESNAAREALNYVERHWLRHSIYREIDQLTPRDFAQAAQRVEATYFIRLYAEFEGILKDHLASYYLEATLPDKPKVDWLIGRVSRLERFSVEAPLRRKMNIVRDYRNSIAHKTTIQSTFVTLDDALSILNRFLARLPDPLT